MLNICSTPQQLNEITSIISKYVRLPFSGDSIPGSIMEAVVAHVRNGEVLNTYDFVDVIDLQNKVGWQVKSTKASTPVTWKRAKIPNSLELIRLSKESPAGLQNLGNAILDFCNDHAIESMDKYGLDEIGFSRLIVHKNGSVTYYERVLCSKNSPLTFDPNDFRWQWSKPKKTKSKEQLPALHGIHNPSGEKWWSWHGLGENQLHFSGEKNWWPSANDHHATSFNLPTEEEKISLPNFIDMLDGL